jgi:hypothetical protein
LACSMKRSGNSIKSHSLDNPYVLESLLLPVGAPLNINSLKCNIGKMSIGGRWLGTALMAAIKVMFYRPSPEVMLPNWLMRFGARILGDTWTMDKPISLAL